jgi:hypothetical protein
VKTESFPASYPVQRKYRRFDLRCPVSLSFDSGGRIRKLGGVSRNVSIGGVLLQVDHSLPPHTHVNLAIDVRAPGSKRSVRLAGEGEVVRVEAAGPDGGFAIAVHCKQPIAEIETLSEIAS